MRRCGTIGCCEAGLGGGGGGGATASGGAGVGALAAGAGGVTTTAGGAAGFSTGGGAGTAGAGLTGGATTTGFSGAAGLTAAAGFSGAGTTTGFLTAATGAGGAGLGGGTDGCCCWSRSFRSRITSPGLEILERSILGLISAWPAFSFCAGADLAEKCFRILSASSASTELEWVFFSVTPTSSNTSRIALLFTSSSLARSLIRIFTLSQVLQKLFTRSYRPHSWFFEHCCYNFLT